MKVAAFGDNCVDYYRNLNRWYVTGNVIDFGANMQLQGVSVSVITATGNDSYGTALISELSRLGIDVSHVQILEGPTAFVELDLLEGERVYRSFSEGVMENVKFSDEDVEFAKTHTLVHFGMWGHADDHIREIHEAGVITSYDFATEGQDIKVEGLLPYIDYAFFSFEKIDDDAKQFLKKIVNNGAGCAVATFGKEGSLAWDGTRFYHFGIVPAEIKNTVGAGDSFISGFMYGILRGESISEAQARGAALASKVIAKFTPW